MTGPSRRSIVAGTVAGAAFAALGSYGAIPVEALAQDGSGSWQFFSASEARFIEAAVDRLIPPERDWAGAREAGVAVYIDRQLAGPFGRGHRLYLKGPFRAGFPGQGYQLGLTPAEVYRTSLRVLAMSGFPDLPPDQQDALLRDLEANQLLLESVPSAVFFETLLANTIEGYFGDPAYGGNRDMVSWRMIGFPGAHAAYLGLYTQHGLRFGRQPISMTDAVHHHSHPHP